jgi:hypothetical protein
MNAHPFPPAVKIGVEALLVKIVDIPIPSIVTLAIALVTVALKVNVPERIFKIPPEDGRSFRAVWKVAVCCAAVPVAVKSAVVEADTSLPMVITFPHCFLTIAEGLNVIIDASKAIIASKDNVVNCHL